MSEEKFELEHFYYGHLIKDDQPEGDLQVLSTSPGISAKLAELCVERVSLPALSASDGKVWAVVRGRSRQTPFILVQAQQGTFAQSIAHYIVFQLDVLKAIGGNLTALSQLLEDELPVFKDTWQKLKRIELAPVKPLTVDEQVDNILELMMATKNRTQVIEPLLAAIVEARQLTVVNAPMNFDARQDFISGLLALLPSSTRFGVTFATYSHPSTDLDTQIRFVDGEETGNEGVVFDWAAAKTVGEMEADDYSHYIVSQLRLDATLVIERNSRMASVAGWRLNEGDKLADALGYASKRFRMDEALQNNQPIDKDEVAKVLIEDPTLTDELRKLYGEHLIRFSLAMNDMSHAEPVAVLLRKHPDLAQSTHQQMQEALRDGQGELILETLQKWMNNPQGPEGQQWVDLLHRTVEAVVAQLAEEGYYDDLCDSLGDLIESGPALRIDGIVTKLIGILLPHAKDDEEVARYTYLLGVKFLDAEGFGRMMGQAALVDQLPPEAKHAWAYLQSGKVDEAPEGFLVKTSHAFGDQWEPLVLLRLVEMAVRAGAKSAIDTPTINNLRNLAMTEHGSQYRDRMLPILNLIDDELLVKLGELAPTYLLQARLALGDYAGVAKTMIHHAMVLYSGDGQADYLNSIYYTFADTPLPEATTLAALKAVHENGIKSLPYAIAIIGALNGLEPSDALSEKAKEASEYLLATEHIHEVVPPSAVLALVQYFAAAHDTSNLMHAASIVPRIAIRRGSRGVKLLSETYKKLDWDETAKQAALQMLKVFVREVPVDIVTKTVTYFAKELGDDVGKALQVTATVRQSMGDRSIMNFARVIHVVVRFLYDGAALYAERAQPNASDVIDALNDMSGMPTDDDRKMAVKLLDHIGQSVIALAEQYRAAPGRGSAEERIDQILNAKTDPKSALDVMRMLAGLLVRGQRASLDVASKTPRQLLATRTVDEWMSEIRATGETLMAVHQTFSKTITVSAADLREEMRSIWEELSQEDHNTLRRSLAGDLQRVIDLVIRIESEGDTKAFADENLTKKIQTGKHKPRNTLEFWRLVQVYYRSRR